MLGEEERQHGAPKGRGGEGWLGYLRLGWWLGAGDPLHDGSWRRGVGL